jgi:hypothetical protein
MIKMYIILHVKYPSLSDFNENWIFWTDFWKVPRYQISWKSVQWEPSYFVRTDGQTDGCDDENTFRDFANAPKNKKKFRKLSSTDIVRS